MTRVLRKTRRCFHRKGILPALFAVLCWMLVGVGLQLRLLQLWQTQMNYSFPALTNSTSSSKEPKYAYAFYATSSSYACGAFVNIAALRDSGSPSTIDFVLLTNGQASNDPGVAEQATKMNVKLKKVDHLKNFKGSNSYYANVMVKLRVFQLWEYDRVIYMDSDMMVRKNLDHLFSAIPDSVPLAAARVTNQQNTDPMRFCSCFMVLKPTPTLWERIMNYYDDASDGYVTGNLLDMDLLNKEFRTGATLLPGTYGALTAIWDNVANGNEEEPTNKWYQQILGEDTSNNSSITTRHELFDATQVLHFTPNKPMIERTLGHIQRNRPDADPRYYAVFERWFSLASFVCPFDDQSKSAHKYDTHKLSKYQESQQYSDYFS